MVPFVKKGVLKNVSRFLGRQFLRVRGCVVAVRTQNVSTDKEAWGTLKPVQGLAPHDQERSVPGRVSGQLRCGRRKPPYQSAGDSQSLISTKQKAARTAAFDY